MKIIATIFMIFLLTSCKPEVKKENLTNLNGYWEIKKVELSNGENKDYKVNETIDFFELKNNQGYRQKVMPKFNGHFETNGIKENIKITENDNTFYINYRTKYGSWKEQIVEIKDSSLILKNQENITYFYKRFKPFTLK